MQPAQPIRIGVIRRALGQPATALGPMATADVRMPPTRIAADDRKFAAKSAHTNSPRVEATSV
jgi:hypothetical protein